MKFPVDLNMYSAIFNKKMSQISDTVRYPSSVLEGVEREPESA